MPRERKSLEKHHLQSTKPQYVIVAGSDVAPGRPKYPKGISGEAKSAFKRLTKMLQDRGHATQGDQEILRLYAILFDRHARAKQHVDVDGEIVECEAVSKNGEIYTVSKENLWLRIMETCETKMSALLRDLGLTPAMRNKIAKVEEKKRPEAEFPTREAATKPDVEGDLLNSIDETKVGVN